MNPTAGTLWSRHPMGHHRPPTHEVSPGNRRERRRRVRTLIGHVLWSRRRQDTQSSFCPQNHSVRGTLLLTLHSWEIRSCRDCLHTHAQVVLLCPEGTRSHCPRIGQRQKHVGCVTGSLNEDVNLAWWVLWTPTEAANRKGPPGPLPVPWTMQLWASAERLSFPDSPVLVSSCSGWHRVKWRLLLYLQLIYIKSERSNSHRVK